MIILTGEDAEKTRGISPSGPWAAIEPVPLKDITFMLGEEVLADPVHADVKDFLDALLKDDPKESDKYQEGDVVPAYPTWKDAGVREIEK